jgi:hypothetical protein
MTRRTFLKRGLIGGALLILGGGATLTLLPTRESGTPLHPLEVLDPRAFQVLVAIARRLVSHPAANPVAIAHGVDAILGRMAPEAQEDMGKLLLLFESALSGLIFDGRVTPFSRRSAADQDRSLLSWRDSRLVIRRTGYQALRKLCFFAHYSMPSSWVLVGYPTPASVGTPYDDSQMGTPDWLKEHGVEGPL